MIRCHGLVALHPAGREVAIALEPLAETKDFLPYLDAVEKSGVRTRRVMYAHILVMVFLLCGFRDHNWPSWPELRVRAAVQAHYCLSYVQDKLDVRNVDVLHRCKIILRHHSNNTLFSTKTLKFIFEGNAKKSEDNEPPPPKQAVTDNLQDRIQLLSRVQVQSRAFQLPLFGAVIDGNDLWTVSGFLSTTLLLVLLAHMRRELQNLIIAHQFCPNNHCKNLLVMSHIFANPVDTEKANQLPLKSLVNHALRQTMFAVMYFLPSVIHILIVYSDIFQEDSYEWSTVTIGSTLTWIEIISKSAFGVILVVLGWRCYNYGRRIDEHVNQIDLEIKES